MGTLLLGLGLVAATALISGFLLFGVKPLPVTDPTKPVGIPSADLKETFGIWHMRRVRGSGRSFLVKIRSFLLIIFWLTATTTAVAAIVGGIMAVIGLFISKAVS